MRISDWSSDVCSSDLGDRARRQIGIPGEAAEGVPVRLVEIGARPVAIRADVRDARDRAQGVAVEPAFDHLRDRRALAPGIGVGVERFLEQRREVDEMGREAEILLGDLHRSEELTSELQSLLRISYAVFCLKKK